MKKARTAIPQLNKMKAQLQQEVNSKCPFCKSKEVGHFQIHHIDEDPSHNEIYNLLLLCPTCHSKITKGEISLTEVAKVKKAAYNKNAEIQFVSTTIDSENCGWEPYDGMSNAFQVISLKSLFPIFNFTFINNSEKTVLLTNIEVTSERLPIGLSGPMVEISTILRPIIKYKIKLTEDGTTSNTLLKEEIVIPKSAPFKFQVELFAEFMESFLPPHNKYAITFSFGFNNDFYMDIPKILLNSDVESKGLRHVLLN